MSEPHVTDRERDLLEAIIVTGTMKLAAGRVGLTYNTAKGYLANLRRRTGLTTEQAIALGVRDGWLVVREPLETAAA